VLGKWQNARIRQEPVGYAYNMRHGCPASDAIQVDVVSVGNMQNHVTGHRVQVEGKCDDVHQGERYVDLSSWRASVSSE
jgi:hypothetical protein